MKFGDKIYNARKELGYSRQVLAELTGLSKRTIAYYELDGKTPKQRRTYEKLGQVLHIDPRNLMDETADFAMLTDELGVFDSGRQAEKLLSEIRGLYAGGTMSDVDMEAMMLAINEAYWLAKKKNAERRRNSGRDEFA